MNQFLLLSSQNTTNFKSTFDVDLENGLTNNTLETIINSTTKQTTNLESDFEEDLKELATSENFDFTIFEHMGIIYNSKIKTFSINSQIFINQFFNKYIEADQIKLIQLYFKIELNRWGNQQIHNKTESHSLFLHVIYTISLFFNIIIPYVIIYLKNKAINSSTSIYFYSIIAIITMINYVLTRFLMATSANSTNYNLMQKNLTKNRLIIESLMLGTNSAILTLGDNIVGLSLTKILDPILSNITHDLSIINQNENLLSNPLIGKLFNLMSFKFVILQNIIIKLINHHINNQLNNLQLSNFQTSNLQTSNLQISNIKLSNPQISNIQLPNTQLNNVKLLDDKLFDAQLPNVKLPNLQSLIIKQL